MGVMKKSLLFGIIFGVLLALPVRADVTVEESTDAEYMINNGFSQTVAEDVFMLKNRVAGKPIEPLYEKSQNCFVKTWRKIYAYIDPSIDEPDRLHHDIKLSPHPSDL